MVEMLSACVFRSRNTYADATAIAFDKQLEMGGGWNAEITVGAVPDSVRELVSIESSLWPSLLTPRGLMSAEILPSDETVVKQRIEGFQLPPHWTDTGHIYTTMTARKDLGIEVRPQDGPEYLWYDFTQASKEVWQSASQAEDGKLLDPLVWFLLEELPADLLADRLTRPRAYLLAPGRRPCPVPQFKVGSLRVKLGKQADQLSAGLSALKATNRVPTKATSLVKISTLMMRQMSEQDPHSRFMFMYAALEIAANAMVGRLKEKLKQSLRIEDPSGSFIGGQAVTELIWPDVENGETRRSLIHRFSVMATMLSPATANDDVVAFKIVSKYRNDTHSELGQQPEPPISKADLLLQRYHPLVTDHLRKHR